MMKKRITIMVLALFIVSLWGTIAFAADVPWGNGSGKGQAKVEQQTRDKVQAGSDDFTVRPNQPAKRLQTLVLFMKTQGLEDDVNNYSISEEQKVLLKKIPASGKAYVAVALEKGLLTEDELKTFNPNQATKGYELSLYKSRIAGEDETAAGNSSDQVVTDEDQDQLVTDEDQASLEKEQDTLFANPMKAVKRFEIMTFLNNLVDSLKALLD